MKTSGGRLVIAIDGPSGAGKSTVARLLAKRLGYLYVDTGAMYRAVALMAKRAGLDPGDERGLEQLCRSIRIEFHPSARDLRTICNGEDVTEEIRRPSVSLLASAISRVPVVRGLLVKIQRELGKEGRVVLEGRDIGTVVFPGAELKFFVDARPEVRGKRRYEELKARGENVDLGETIHEIEQRDADDRNRAIAPLHKAVDAVLIDTTGLSVDEVVERMIQAHRERVVRSRQPVC